MFKTTFIKIASGEYFLIEGSIKFVGDCFSI